MECMKHLPCYTEDILTKIHWTTRAWKYVYIDRIHSINKIFFRFTGAVIYGRTLNCKVLIWCNVRSLCRFTLKIYYILTKIHWTTRAWKYVYIYHIYSINEIFLFTGAVIYSRKLNCKVFIWWNVWSICRFSKIHWTTRAWKYVYIDHMHSTNKIYFLFTGAVINSRKLNCVRFTLGGMYEASAELQWRYAIYLPKFIEQQERESMYISIGYIRQTKSSIQCSLSLQELSFTAVH